MSGIDHQYVDSVEQFRREQADVVLEGLKVVARLRVIAAVSEHLAQVVVLAHQFMHPVIVAVEVEPDDAAHQDCPQRHARTPVALADLGRYLAFEQLEDRVAQRYVGVQVLQSLQYLGNVVPRFIVKTNLGYVYFSDPHLLILDYPHGSLPL